MMHGPCDARCLENGKCKKKFPKAFQNETAENADGYPSTFSAMRDASCRGDIPLIQFLVQFRPLHAERGETRQQVSGPLQPLPQPQVRVPHKRRNIVVDQVRQIFAQIFTQRSRLGDR